MYCEEPVVYVQIRDVNFVLEGVGQIPPVSSFINFEISNLLLR